MGDEIAIQGSSLTGTGIVRKGPGMPAVGRQAAVDPMDEFEASKGAALGRQGPVSTGDFRDDIHREKDALGHGSDAKGGGGKAPGFSGTPHPTISPDKWAKMQADGWQHAAPGNPLKTPGGLNVPDDHLLSPDGRIVPPMGGGGGATMPTGRTTAGPVKFTIKDDGLTKEKDALGHGSDKKDERGGESDDPDAPSVHRLDDEFETAADMAIGDLIDEMDDFDSMDPHAAADEIAGRMGVDPEDDAAWERIVSMVQDAQSTAAFDRQDDRRDEERRFEAEDDQDLGFDPAEVGRGVQEIMQGMPGADPEDVADAYLERYGSMWEEELGDLDMDARADVFDAIYREAARQAGAENDDPEAPSVHRLRDEREAAEEMGDLDDEDDASWMRGGGRPGQRFEGDEDPLAQGPGWDDDEEEDDWPEDKALPGLGKPKSPLQRPGFQQYTRPKPQAQPPKPKPAGGGGYGFNNPPFPGKGGSHRANPASGWTRD